MLNTSSISAKHLINLVLYFLRNATALNYLSDLQMYVHNSIPDYEQYEFLTGMMFYCMNSVHSC